MTKHTAGILGSLTMEALRAMTDAELDAKATAIENTSDGDGFISTADEADLCLLHREQARREDVAAEAPVALGWFLATIRPRQTNEAHVLLVQAADGAEVEDALKAHGYDGADAGIRWEPLADLRYGIVDVSRLTVIPAVSR